MFSTHVRRAAAVSAPKLSEVAGQLLPPIPLLRRLLRVQRRLPEEMRFMGDAYVKAEFRRTRSTDNPIYIIGFLQTWKVYLDDLEAQTAREGDAFRGRKLSEETFEQLSNEQAGQLYELMHATKDIWKSPEELEAAAVKQEIERAKEDEAAVQADKAASR